MLLHDRAVNLNCSHTHKSQGKVIEQTRQEGGPWGGGGGGARRKYMNSENQYYLSESYGTVNMRCHDALQCSIELLKRAVPGQCLH